MSLKTIAVCTVSDIGVGGTKADEEELPPGPGIPGLASSPQAMKLNAPNASAEHKISGVKNLELI
ncbi:MAG: hypothetical protein IKS97_08465 [Fibrobacter sp.]|jgi:hypothetical protein|nr:hypothetical protein [Fibrobacter sp.]